MFFCEPCRKKEDWPESLLLSKGRCEICKKTAICHDVKSSDLPKPPPPPLDGHQEATNVDKIINHLLAEHPITKENAHEWVNFARTVSTSTKILLETCIDVLGIPREDSDGIIPANNE